MGDDSDSQNDGSLTREKVIRTLPPINQIHLDFA